jgi:FkbM family methyltransferase
MRFITKSRVVINALLGKMPYHNIQINCPSEFHGTKYGGWTICPLRLSNKSIVYSFGIGEDISFDVSLINKYALNIFAFDPTPKSLRWIKSQKLPNEFNCFEYGIADYDGLAKFYPPKNTKHVSYTLLNRGCHSNQVIEIEVRKLKTIIDTLGHQKIDILKMDIEGAEYGVLEDILNSGINISQICVEFHHRFIDNGISRTNSAIQLLNDHCYKIFSISDSMEEYSFINEYYI